jgi:hypothetical protein
MAAVQDNALFDSHLQSLLKNAEKRLEEKSRSLDTADESPRHEAIPQYDPEKRLVTRPYVAVEDGIARAQAAPQPGQTHQHSSNSLIRRVEDPAVTRERATKVGHTFFKVTVLMRKISQNSLEADTQLRLGAPSHSMRAIEHSYSEAHLETYFLSRT